MRSSATTFTVNLSRHSKGHRMRSGNGKHRRPRQAPALVAAGVAGSAIAIPLLGASGASAAEAATWDRVADCESGGMWSANVGNGYYGGLQFSTEDWQRFGGTAYAPRADLASRSQQIKVAEKVLAAEGPQAWASCALLSGLTESDGASSAESALPDTPAEAWGETPAEETPDETLDGTKSSETPESDPSGQATAETPAGTDGESVNADRTDGAGEAAESTTPPASENPAEADGTTESPASGENTTKGKHRGGEAREDGGVISGDSGTERESGRHASRSDGSARDAAKAGEGEAGEYTVRAGDNLWAIADAHDVSGGWQALYDANEKVVGSDPDLILPGQSLDLG